LPRETLPERPSKARSLGTPFELTNKKAANQIDKDSKELTAKNGTSNLSLTLFLEETLSNLSDPYTARQSSTEARPSLEKRDALKGAMVQEQIA
jgi:hypothetical protein